MAIPKYDELYAPFLDVLKDGEIHPLKEVRQEVIKALMISEAELAERLASGTQTVMDNRLGWARTYLKKAELIASPSRAHYAITAEGKKLLQSGVKITNELMMQYPAFAAFMNKGASAVPSVTPAPIEPEPPKETPQETLEHMYEIINEQLADDLLTEIMSQSPAFFEQVVVDLMRAMGYGDGFVTRQSSDGGIDGIIHEDKLGFNLIYIQARACFKIP